MIIVFVVKVRRQIAVAGVGVLQTLPRHTLHLARRLEPLAEGMELDEPDQGNTDYQREKSGREAVAGEARAEVQARGVCV